MEKNFDVIVIGAGVAGLSVAYELSTQARVAVLERESQPAYHSSGRSAAVYIEAYENPVVNRLTVAGKPFYFDPPDGFCEHGLVSRCGGLTCGGPGEEHLVTDFVSQWQDDCPELATITPAEARQIVPILNAAWLQAACYDPTWQSIDIHELLMGYQRGVKRNGGTLILNAEVRSLSHQAGDWRIQTQAERYTAAVVVNASGAWANTLAELAGLAPLPLTPMRRHAAIVPLPESVDWPLVHTADESLYFKPESPGLMVSPADELPSLATDAYPDDLAVAESVARFETVTDLNVTRLHRQWAGLRTFAPDRCPVVGFDPRTSGFFWLAGQGGFGFQTAPGLAALAAAAVAGESKVEAEINVARWLT